MAGRRYRLETSSGDWAHEGETLPFLVEPSVIIWEARAFAYYTTEHGTWVYREVWCWWVPLSVAP